MATVSSLTTDVIEYLTAQLSGSTATSQDIVLQTKAIEQLGNAQSLLNAVQVAITEQNVDWSAGQVFTKTITTDTTLTFTNYSVGQCIDLVITGNALLYLPVEVNTMFGGYDGTKSNLIQLKCTQASPAIFWAGISQPLT